MKKKPYEVDVWRTHNTFEDLKILKNFLNNIRTKNPTVKSKEILAMTLESLPMEKISELSFRDGKIFVKFPDEEIVIKPNTNGKPQLFTLYLANLRPSVCQSFLNNLGPDISLIFPQISINGIHVITSQEKDGEFHVLCKNEVNVLSIEDF